MNGHAPASPEYVRAWGKHARGSPLYQRLIEVIAASPELMRILNRIENQPRPNLLFAGVQYLVAQGADPQLAAFYPSLVEDPLPPAGVEEAFIDFVVAHEEQLVEIGRTRLTQTNECRRCAALLPAIWLSGLDRFHLVDLGTSAGLNLAIDRYSYRWADIEWGDGPVEIEAESRGAPPRPRAIEILSRTGLDLNPIDVSSSEERAWLNALIWPEQSERRRRLQQAVDLIAGLDLEVIAGDALETLGPFLDGLPGNEAAVVMNSFVLIQFTDEGRQRVDRIIDHARGRRPIFRVSMEVLVKTDDWARLTVDDGSGWREVGQAHPHGEWVELFL